MEHWETTEKEKYDNAYRKGYTPMGAAKYFRSDICEFIKKNATQTVKLLDVGCGPAYGYEVSKNYDIDYFGIDISESLVPYWEHCGVPARVASASNMPFDDSSFDFIVAWDVMEHIPEKYVQSVFQEVIRVGKDNSMFHFSICLTEEILSMKQWGQLHMTIKNQDWWLQQLRDAKGFIFNGNYPKGSGNNLSGLAQIAK